MLNRWRRNRKHETRPVRQICECWMQLLSDDPKAYEAAHHAAEKSGHKPNLAEWHAEGCVYLKKQPPYIAVDGHYSYWYPAALRPNECLWDRDFRCIRDDHQHGGEQLE
ncbi:hypothetical protein ACFYY5_29390 [Nocardia elegans]|uniref:Uncharacterized protein n=1 Tax=Nocardia elegans TaxID=300029 RepID=A0ABW6TLF3_9NOCA